MPTIHDLNIGAKEINDRGGAFESWHKGYLDGWPRVGIGMRPLKAQTESLIECGVTKLQFDFNHEYGDTPKNMEMLRSFREVQAVECDAWFAESDPLNDLSDLKSFRDNVYNRTGVNWQQFEGIQDLGLYDYHGKYHPDYTIFKDLRSLSLTYLPRKYSSAKDLPLSKVELLSISNAKFTSLEGFGGLDHLRELLITKSRKFTTDGLDGNLPNLKRLCLFSCPNVRSLECVRSMPNLEVLELEKVGEIASFEPLMEHPNLKRIDCSTLKGARMSKKVLDSLPRLEFISKGIVAD